MGQGVIIREAECLRSLAGRRFLVTGHSGFMGAWLTAWLRLLGANVTGFSRPPELDADSRAMFDGTPDTACFGDIRDLGLVTDVLDECDPDVVIHLAAQSLVRRSYREPYETFAVNAMGTCTLLEALRRKGSVNAVLVATTDKVYRNDESGTPFSEDAPLGGGAPYDSSKAATEFVVEAYLHAYFEASATGIAAVRAGNVFGGGDWAADRLVPDLIRAFVAGRPAILRNPASIRPWQYVLDPLRGYLLLAAAMLEDPHAYSGAWNFGPGPQAHVPVSQLANRFAAQWPGATCEHVPDGDGPKEAGILRLDSSKAERLLGWRPMADIEDALTRSSRWYRNVLVDGLDGLDAAETELKNYMSDET